MGTASGRLTADVSDFPPRYALRGKIDNFEPAPVATWLTGLPLLSGRSVLKLDLKTTGQTPTEVLKGLAGTVGLNLAEGGKLGLDLRAIRAGAETVANPSQLVKGATGIDALEARAKLVDGLLVTEHVQAKAAGHSISASGSANLLDRTLDVRLLVQPAPGEKAPPSEAGSAGLILNGPWALPSVRQDTAGDPTAR
jgi:AsmA protein